MHLSCKENQDAGIIMKLFIPCCIQDDAEEVRRKRRRHTFVYVEEHSDEADNGGV